MRGNIIAEQNPRGLKHIITMNLLLRLIFFALLLILPDNLLLADTLILKSGKVLECKILEKTKDYIRIEYAGQPLYYENKYVQQIQETPFVPEAIVLEQPPVSAEEWSKEIADEKGLKNKNSGIKAVILAHPSLGSSPLSVVFDGSNSSSQTGKIVSYYWDFGDGDTADQVKVKNTFFSLSYGSRLYTVKLTVKDNQGNTAFASYPISVTNKNL